MFWRTKFLTLVNDTNGSSIYTPLSPASPLYLQAFVATGTNLSLQFFPANLLGDQRQVPTREYVDFERETGKVGRAQDTPTLTCVTLCPPCAAVRETSTDFNIRWRVAAFSHDFSDTFHGGEN